MPRPTSPKVTLELLDQFLTYDPQNGELRTRATRKLVDPVRPTKIGGVSINPARAAFAMGNLYIWDKVGFKDGNPRNLKLDNLTRADANLYIKTGKPRKPYTRKPGPDSCVGREGLVTVTEPPPIPWQKRLSAPQNNLLPQHNLWASFLKRHFSYSPDTGVLTIRATGNVITATDKYGTPRTVSLPKFADAKHQSIRIDRLAWLLATNRLPGKETTRLSAPSLKATSIQWHPDGIPRTPARPVAKPSGGRWLAFTYYNRRLTKVGGFYAIEEEALAAANAHTGVTDHWTSGLVTLADYMGSGMKDHHRDEPAVEETRLPDLDDEEPAPPAAPTPARPSAPDTYVEPDYFFPDYDDDEEDTPVGPSLMSITGEMRKPWSYTPIVVDLD